MRVFSLLKVNVLRVALHVKKYSFEIFSRASPGTSLVLLITLFSSEHPATVFTVLEPPPPVGPQQQQQPAKQKLTFTSDTLFDLLLLKLEKFYQKRLKIESKGSRFELGDFVVKVRTMSIKWHPKKLPLWRLIA